MIFSKPPPPTRHQVELDTHQILEAVAGDVPGHFPHLDAALRITGGFEGRGFSQITGDFDRQGISAGILQWNLGTGSLQRVILRPYLAKHGSIDALGIFPEHIEMLASKAPTEGVAFARAHMLSGAKVRKEWATAWSAFLVRPEVVAIQKAGCDGVAKSAANMSSAWGMNSQKAFCYFFDVATQNGSMKGVTPPRASHTACESYLSMAPISIAAKAIWSSALKTAMDADMVLFQAGYLRAKLANPKYFGDVFSRKGTIALGRGIVHGKTWDLFPS